MSYQEAEEQLARLEGGYEAFGGGASRPDSSASSLLGSASAYAPDIATASTLEDIQRIPSADEPTIVDELPPQASSRSVKMQKKIVNRKVSKARTGSVSTIICTLSETGVQAAIVAISQVNKDRSCAVCTYKGTSYTELGVRYVHEHRAGEHTGMKRSRPPKNKTDRDESPIVDLTAAETAVDGNPLLTFPHSFTRLQIEAKTWETGNEFFVDIPDDVDDGNDPGGLEDPSRVADLPLASASAMRPANAPKPEDYIARDDRQAPQSSDHGADGPSVLSAAT